MVCKECSYYGVVDVDENDNLIWSCTRKTCINFKDEEYKKYGFENEQDFVEFKYKIRW